MTISASQWFDQEMDKLDTAPPTTDTISLSLDQFLALRAEWLVLLDTNRQMTAAAVNVAGKGFVCSAALKSAIDPILSRQIALDSERDVTAAMRATHPSNEKKGSL